MRNYFSFGIIFILLSLGSSTASRSCYTSIYSFGDSVSDNGNLCALSAPTIIHQCLLPNGETYFDRPTGRCCDGRLIIDFLAQSLGLPIPPPYIPIKKEHIRSKIYTGVNFAVAGARAVNSSFYSDRGIGEPYTNVSLTTQVDWFKKLLPSLCNTKADCLRYLKGSLVYVEIGGNDYMNSIVVGQRSIEEVATFVPVVVDAISIQITAMIELGVMSFMVAGSFPIGCGILNIVEQQATGKDSDFEESTGCVKSPNQFAMYHNHLLQIELDNLRKRHPHVTISYADFYNSAIRLFRNPEQFGFRKDKLRACCGGGEGPYNWSPSMDCGDPGSKSCTDPSNYVSWDGLHYTEAANKVIFQSLLEGPYSIPPLKTICPSPLSYKTY